MSGYPCSEYNVIHFFKDDVRDKISTCNTFKEIGKLILMQLCTHVYCDNMQIKGIYKRQ